MLMRKGVFLKRVSFWFLCDPPDDVTNEEVAEMVDSYLKQYLPFFVSEFNIKVNVMEVEN